MYVTKFLVTIEFTLFYTLNHIYRMYVQL